MKITIKQTGEITLPDEILKQVGASKGDLLALSVENGKLILEPVNTQSNVDKLYGILKEGPDLLTELEKEHREEIESEKGFATFVQEIVKEVGGFNDLEIPPRVPVNLRPSFEDD